MINMERNKGISLTTLVLVVVAILIIVALAVLLMGGNEEKDNVSQENKSVEEFVEVLGDGTKLNTSSKLSETKTIEGLTISDFQLTEKGSQTVLLGKIRNNGSQARGGFPATVIILDKAGSEIVRLVAYIPEVAPNGEEELNVSSTLDYANAYDIRIEKM